MNPVAAEFHHRAQINDDGSDSVQFRWHWPRNLLQKRMSALELAEFILPHMPSILPLLSDHPKVYAEFQILLMRLVTWPKSQVLDELLPWIKTVIRGEEDDIIVMDLGSKNPQPIGPIYSLPSA